MPVYTAIGAAGALMCYDEVKDADSAKKALLDIAGLDADSELSELITSYYKMFKADADVIDVRIVAEVDRQSEVEII